MGIVSSNLSNNSMEINLKKDYIVPGFRREEQMRKDWNKSQETIS